MIIPLLLAYIYLSLLWLPFLLIFHSIFSFKSTAKVLISNWKAAFFLTHAISSLQDRGLSPQFSPYLPYQQSTLPNDSQLPLGTRDKMGILIKLIFFRKLRINQKGN